MVEEEEWIESVNSSVVAIISSSSLLFFFIALFLGRAAAIRSRNRFAVSSFSLLAAVTTFPLLCCISFSTLSSPRRR